MRFKMIFPLLALAALGCSEPKTNYAPLEVDPANIVEDMVPGQIELDLADGLNADDISKLAKDYGIVIRDNSPQSHNLGNIAIATVDPEKENEILSRLARDPRVEVAEPLIMAHALFTPNDPQYKDQWHMERVGAPTAWNYSCGQGVVVAVVDTGITAEDTNGFKVLSDLKDATFVPGYNFVSPGKPPHDDQGHGSHCAGTIAQTTNNGIGVAGLSHCVKLMPVKVLAANGSGTMADVAEGIIWAANNGANVISLSLGASRDSAVVAKAVKYAHAKGSFLSCAAGNDSGPVGYPAANKGCVAVSASDQSDNLAKFSSHGKEVALSAPGVAVTQQTITEGGKGEGKFAAFNGTSMATPHVSGAAALLMSQGMTDPDKVLETLQSNAVAKQDANKFGAGILDSGTATRNVFIKHTLYRVAFLAFFVFVVLTVFKKHGKALITDTTQIGGAAIGAVLASLGVFFFLPLVGVLPHMGSFRWVGEILSRPMGDWDLVWNANLHSWLPLANALPAFGLVALGFHRPILRSVAGGLAVGTAAYLAQTALSGESLFVFGTFAMRLWTMVNIAACLWVAKNTLAK